MEYLAVVVDPEHELQQGMLLWQGPFDPEAFDAQKATKQMQKGLPGRKK